MRNESANVNSDPFSDGVFPDEVLEALKKAADTNCLLCEIEDLGDDD